jgi:acyl-ACP thioesterase
MSDATADAAAMPALTADIPADERRAITVPYRARFDECGPDGLVRSSALLRYAQDLAWLHSERLGFTRAWYAERNLAWVVRAAELVILAPLPLGQVISLTTQVIGFRRVWGHTDWVILDTARGMPGRFPPEFLARFDVPPDPFEPGRVTLPPVPPDTTSVPHATTVRPQDIDPMGHVNNAAYLDYLEEALLAEGGRSAALTSAIPRRFRIEYVVPAASGAVLASRLWPLATEAGDRAGAGDAGDRSEGADGSEAAPGPDAATDGLGRAWRLDGADGRELARALVTADLRG